MKELYLFYVLFLWGHWDTVHGTRKGTWVHEDNEDPDGIDTYTLYDG